MMKADLIRLGENARRASAALMTASAPAKNAALESIARTLEENAADRFPDAGAPGRGGYDL